MSDFWTRKLGGTQYGRGGRREIQPVSPSSPPAPAQPPQYAAPSTAPRQASHLRQSIGACPNCDSGDYIKAGASIQARCYTCGYPNLHSTSGMVATERTTSKKVTPTRQLAMSMDGGFSPQTIIGRIE